MELMTSNNKQGIVRSRPTRMMAVVFWLVVLGFAELGFAQQAVPETFASPGEASNALFQAVQNDDDQALQLILGAGKDVTSSNDEIEDKLERDGFIKKYQEM